MQIIFMSSANISGIECRGLVCTREKATVARKYRKNRGNFEYAGGGICGFLQDIERKMGRTRAFGGAHASAGYGGGRPDYKSTKLF